MPRVKRGVAHLKRRKNILKRVKGFYSRRKNTIRMARQAILNAGVHAFDGRKVKKSEYRQLFQIRINAAVRPHGLKYSVFMNLLKKNQIALDRKVLSEMAAQYPDAFKQLIDQVKA